MSCLTRRPDFAILAVLRRFDRLRQPADAGRAASACGRRHSRFDPGSRI